MQQCSSCGYTNPAGEALCAQCGRPLVADAAKAVPPPPAVPASPPEGTPVGSAVPPPPLLPFPGFPGQMPPGVIPYGVPISLHPPEPRGRNVGFFFLGLGVGILAAILSIYGTNTLASSQFGSGGLWYLGCIPAVAALVGMIVCLSIRKVRFIGYGLLAVVVGSPVIFAVGCILILTGSRFLHP